MILGLGGDDQPVVLLLVQPDGMTPAADDVAPVVEIRQYGGQFAPADNAPMLIGRGWWELALSQAECSVEGPLILVASAPGTLEWRDMHQVGRAAVVEPSAPKTLEFAGSAPMITKISGAIDARALVLGPELIANPTFAGDARWKVGGAIDATFSDGVLVTATDAGGYRQLVQDHIDVEPGIYLVDVDYDGDPFQMHIIHESGRVLSPTWTVAPGTVEKPITAGYGDVMVRMIFNNWKPGQSSRIRRVGLRRVDG